MSWVCLGRSHAFCGRKMSKVCKQVNCNFSAWKETSPGWESWFGNRYVYTQWLSAAVTISGVAGPCHFLVTAKGSRVKISPDLACTELGWCRALFCHWNAKMAMPAFGEQRWSISTPSACDWWHSFPRAFPNDSKDYFWICYCFLRVKIYSVICIGELCPSVRPSCGFALKTTAVHLKIPFFAGQGWAVVQDEWCLKTSLCQNTYLLFYAR